MLALFAQVCAGRVCCNRVSVCADTGGGACCCQILALMNSTYKVQWPPDVSDTMETASFINFRLLSLTPLTCVDGLTYYHSLSMNLGTPALALIIIWVMYRVQYYFLYQKLACVCCVPGCLRHGGSLMYR